MNPSLRDDRQQTAFLIRSGILVFSIGYGAALLAVIVIANAAIDYKVLAEWFHRVAMWTMLIGAILMLGGYRQKFKRY